MREAVRLDWRLLWRSLQQSSGGLWMTMAIGILSASTLGESSARLGALLASGRLTPDQALLMLGVQVWAAFGAAFAFALMTGELRFSRRLLTDLSVRPVSRRQAFVALQAVSIGGRHALAPLTAGLPLLILLDAWLDGASLAAAIAASVVMMRLPVALVTVGSRVLSASPRAAIAGSAAAAMVAAGLWRAAPDLVVAATPPVMVLRILIEGSTVGAWAGLAAWTAALAAVEFWSMRLEETAPARGDGTQRFTAVPGFIRAIARLSGCAPVLLHAELLRLTRWRRFYLAGVMCAVLMALFGGRLRDSADPIRLVLFLLVPVQVGGSLLANMFATDRGGFQAFLLAPVSMGGVVRAKVIALGLFTIAAELAGIAFLAARGAVPWPAIAAAGLLAAGFLAWVTAIGLVTSVLFPSPSDPQTIGGALVNTSAGIVITLGMGLYAGAALGLAFVFDSGRWPPAACAVAAVAMVAAAVGAALVSSRASTRLISLRKERMVFELTTSPGTRA